MDFAKKLAEFDTCLRDLHLNHELTVSETLKVFALRLELLKVYKSCDSVAPIDDKVDEIRIVVVE